MTRTDARFGKWPFDRAIDRHTSDRAPVLDILILQLAGGDSPGLRFEEAPFPFGLDLIIEQEDKSRPAAGELPKRLNRWLICLEDAAIPAHDPRQHLHPMLDAGGAGG